MPLYTPSAAGRIPAYTKLIRTAGDLTNTSATPVLLPTVTLVCSGYDVLLQMFCMIEHTGSTANFIFQPRLDGSIPGGLSNARVLHMPATVSGDALPCLSWVFAAPSAGSHTFGWDFASGTAGTQTVKGSTTQPLIIVAQELLT